MTDLRQQHKEICSRYDSAVIEFNSLHRKAKAIKQKVIVPLELEMKQIEADIQRKLKSYER